MELCKLLPNQRYPYKLSDDQTAKMIKFAAQQPRGHLEGIDQGLHMLAWANDSHLKQHKVAISNERIQTNARILPAPALNFCKSIVKPGKSGWWDLKGKAFVAGNPKELISWGVMVIKSSNSAENIPSSQAKDFVKSFVKIYRDHGGTVSRKYEPEYLEVEPRANLVKAIADIITSVRKNTKEDPQILIFILPNKNSDVYLRIKKDCDCHWGVYSQCVQVKEVRKVNNDRYISNLLMKVNAKLGGTTNRIDTKESQQFFDTMIIGADVSHSAPGVHAPSYAAMTVSMDSSATRYAAGVQTNGFRDEIIKTQNLRTCLEPLFSRWQKAVGKGNLPNNVYYFRDGVSESRFTEVLATEVADMKNLFLELDHRKKIKFTVVVAEKRHHIRFFPQDGDKNGNPFPGTIVERDVTDPFGNDFYLCSHTAIQGTARPVHYTMLINEIGVSVDRFQKMLYEQCYQYIRSATAVSLHPAVYYAHLASKRARAHDTSVEQKGSHDKAPNPKSKSPPEEPASLRPIPDNKNGMRYGMWYI
ncbi:MAG: hypothetical protein Q9224_006056 [Gallowayella concinna]